MTWGGALPKIALLLAFFCAGCVASPPTVASNGQTACLVRGLGGPLTSYLTAGRGALEALGYRVAVHDMGALPADLADCSVIVAHSAGAVPALEMKGPRLIFVIDGFASMLQRCPSGARCVNFYNLGDVLSETLAGARNVNCFTDCGVLDAVPLLAHMTMPASPAVWAMIEQEIADR